MTPTATLYVPITCSGSAVDATRTAMVGGAGGIGGRYQL